MSVVQNPIIGRASGKFSTAIFQKWKNKNVLRSKPLTVANPDTVNQQMRRGMFKACVALARYLSPVLIVGFSTFKATLTWMNVFIKENNGVFTLPATAPSFTEDYSGLIISSGPMSITAIDSITATDASPTVTIAYSNTTGAPDQSLSDPAYAVVINETQGNIAYSLGSKLRSDGSVALTMPANSASSDVIYAYLFFQASDGSMVSNSIADTVTVA